MKRFFVVLIFVLLAGNSFILFSSPQQTKAFQKGMKYLDIKGEVRLKFKIESRLDLLNLSNFVYIDNVTDNLEVYAYANRDQFNKLKEYGFNYEVPSELNDPPKGVVTGGYAECIENNLPYEWDTYPTYQEYVNMMGKFASDYPELCKLEEFGTTIRGRKMLAVKITDNADKQEAEPKFFYQSTIHGDEICGYVLTLRLADYLLSRYNSDSRVKRLVDSVEIWINPDGNPDGTYNGGNSSVNGSRRTNASGVDLNRTFPCPTGRPMAQEQKETRIVVDFCKEKGFTLEADFHGGAELVAYIWGCWSRNVADRDWWILVSKEWAENAQQNSPGSYFTQEGGYTNAYAWYVLRGERMNGATYFQKSRDLTVELSYKKQLESSKLRAHWDYQKESLLRYMEQILNGVRGTVTDSITGEPLKAKVEVLNHDKDSSHIYSSLPHGDYYRLIKGGTYSFKFTALDPTTMQPDVRYSTKTIPNVRPRDNQATILNVKLFNDQGTIKTENLIAQNDLISFGKQNGALQISFKPLGAKVKAGIYDINGRFIRLLKGRYASGLYSTTWDGKDNSGMPISDGCYVVRLSSENQTVAKSFVFQR